MIIGLFRVAYLLGPILALAIILLPGRRNVAWWFWGFSLAIVVMHWISFFSATQADAEKVSIFGIATWTPLIVTTAIAGFTEKYWRGWHANSFASQGSICLLCLLPSLVAFFLTR